MLRTLAITLICGLALFTGALVWQRASIPSDGTVIQSISPDGALVEPQVGMTSDLHGGDIVQAINGVAIDRALPSLGTNPPAAIPW